MQFLCDENVYFKTVKFLKQLNNKAITVQEKGLRSTSDLEILSQAIKGRRILLTRDTDFFNLALFSKIPHYGVVVLRITPQTEDEVHEVLEIFLKKYKSKEIKDRLVIINTEGYKIEKRIRG